MSSNTKVQKILHVFLLNILLSLFYAHPCNGNTHTIQFGGPIHGFTYFPDSLNVFVGDTIKWVGDFKQYPLQISGAALIGPIDSGNTFSFVVSKTGTYNFQNNIYAPIGMKGFFRAFNQNMGGITNEGRDFYLGMLTYSYNNVRPPSEQPKVYAYISSHYDNLIYISYFNEQGNDDAFMQYHIPSGNSLQVSLNTDALLMDTASDAQVFKSCHIRSKYPITVFYIGVGLCAGGSYLALPVLGLGKKYVAACYNDDAGNGDLYFPNNPNGSLPTKLDYAGGEFEIIGTEDATDVKITPTTTTATGHQGANTGTPHPYTIKLNRGQCYLARSDGKNEIHDLSGSLIESSKPIAVLSGHENAFLGGSDPFPMEQRDHMVEQMVPVEYWDNIGYISIPLAEGNPPGDAGSGDAYRMYAFDNINVAGKLNVQGISGGYDMTAQRLLSPPERDDIATPVEAYSTNGQNFSLMQYEERSQTRKKSPNPSPSMMTVVPVSRWKTSYQISPFYTHFSDASYENIYMNVISPNLSKIFLTVNNSNPTSLSTLTKIHSYSNLSKNFPELSGAQYRLTSGGLTFTLTSSLPFMVYFYGMRDYCADSPHLGDTTDINFNQEYAAPAGMQLNTGVIPSFIVDTLVNCTGWHICVHDTGYIDPGIKAVILIDDPDGVSFPYGGKYSNVSFDETSSDYADGELHPHFHSSGSYCFDVNFTSPLAAASAPLAIVDNLGNAIILRLDRVAPAVKLTTSPAISGKADSIVFPVKKIGEQICTTFVLKNTAVKGGTAINVNSAVLSNADTTYKLQTITPSLPHSIAAGDSITMQVCYTPIDSSRHQDSLLLKTDCFNLTISLDAHGSTGLISAGDLDFKSITVGDTLCKNVLIRNVGSAPFSVTSYLLSDTLNYTVSGSFPALLTPNASIMVNICFHPKTEGSYSAGIDWNSDLESAFKHSVKDHTSLTGQATPKQSVKENEENNSFSIHPNPANGNSIVVTFGTGGLRVRPTNEGAILKMYDVLGREVYHQSIAAAQEKLIIPIGALPEGTYYIDYSSKVERFVRVK
jgi:plastocyanin